MKKTEWKGHIDLISAPCDRAICGGKGGLETVINMSSTAPLTLHWLRVDFVYFLLVDLFIFGGNLVLNKILYGVEENMSPM